MASEETKEETKQPKATRRTWNLVAYSDDGQTARREVTGSENDLRKAVADINSNGIWTQTAGKIIVSFKINKVVATEVK